MLLIVSENYSITVENSRFLMRDTISIRQDAQEIPQRRSGTFVKRTKIISGASAGYVPPANADFFETGNNYFV